MESVNKALNIIQTIKVMSDKFVDGKFAKHNFIDQLRDILTGFPSSKSSSFPASTSDQLKWARR